MESLIDREKPAMLERSITYSTVMMFSCIPETIDQVAHVEKFPAPLRLRIVELIERYTNVCARELAVKKEELVLLVSLRLIPARNRIFVSVRPSDCHIDWKRSLVKSIAELTAEIEVSQYGHKLFPVG